MSQLPMLGNLAWAPVPALENVEVLDRFNGVPTLGLFSSGAERMLFWRATGYVGQFSIWLYVAVDEAAERRLSSCEGADTLTGLVFDSPTERYVTVGIAKDYRLAFEREWCLPENLSADELIHELLTFLTEALDIMLKQKLPRTRREMMRQASRAVKELASAAC